MGFTVDLIFQMKANTVAIFLAFWFMFALNNAHAQRDNAKGSLYGYWGYNRAHFSPSNLHFSGPDYDFTLYDVKATDRPTKFGKEYFNLAKLSIPQYNVRLGYHLNDRFAVSFGNDHMKYVVASDQAVRISGVIDSFNLPSRFYDGQYLNDTITLSPDFFAFEHSDGFNFVSIDVEYLQPLKEWRGLAFDWNNGIGGVWMVTRTRVFIMEDGLDNDFHIAGFAMAAKTGPQLSYKNKLFLLGEVKAGYAYLPWVLVKNEAPILGDHAVGFLEYYVCLGYRFKLGD